MEMVYIINPGLPTPAKPGFVSRDAFEQVWSHKGFVVVTKEGQGSGGGASATKKSGSKKPKGKAAQSEEQSEETETNGS